MAVVSKMIGQAGIKAFNKEIKWSPTGGDTFKAMLFTGAIPVASQDGWVYLSDITGITEVASGNGYTTGGQTLTNLTVGYTAGTNTIKFSCDPITWANSTISAASCIVYDSTGTASTSPLICTIDFGATLSSSSAAFTITPDSAGLFTMVCP